MATSRTSRVLLRNSKIILTSTKFDDKGDSVTSTMNISTGTMTKEVYTRKHVVYSGAFVASFPGTDEPSEYGGLGVSFPTKEAYKIADNRFTVTADEPGSVYYCVFPIYDTDKIVQVERTLAPGDTVTVSSGTVAFVFGSNFMVNGTTSTEIKTVLACEKKSAVIAAQTENCQLLELTIAK
jgi:hypothetical protein